MQALGFGLWSTEERCQLKEIETLNNFLDGVGVNGWEGIFPFDIQLLNK